WRDRLLLEVRDSLLDARENAVHLEAGIVDRLEPPRRTCLGVGAHELAVAGRRVAVARDLEPSPAADPPDLGGELLRRHHHALEPGAVRNPAVPARGAAQHRVGIAADPHRPRPQRADKVEPVVEEPRATVCVEVLAELDELLLVPAEAGPQDDPAVVERGHRRHLLREHLRATARDGRDRGAERQPSRRRSDGGERRPRIGGRGPPHEGEVVPDEEPVPSRRLCRLRDANGRARIGVAAEVGEDDGELHRWTNRGARFSANAVRPSLVSALAKSSPNSRASASNTPGARLTRRFAAAIATALFAASECATSTALSTTGSAIALTSPARSASSASTVRPL